MRIVGLTGRMGAGKSTVARWLADLGATSIDADALVAELYATDDDLHTQLRARFGEAVVRDGRVDKLALRAAFADPAALGDLERIVHPAVHRLRDEQLAAARANGAPVSVVEAIRLVESGGSAICDELWIVTANEDALLPRLGQRGVAPDDARRRLATQGSLAGWTDAFLAESARLTRPRPVVVFDNSGTEADGRRAAQRLWRGLSGSAGRDAP